MTQKVNTATAAVVYPLIWIDSQVVSKCVPSVCNPSDCWNHHKATTSSVPKSKVRFPLGSLLMSPFWFLNPFSVVVVVVLLRLLLETVSGVAVSGEKFPLMDAGYATLSPVLQQQGSVWPGPFSRGCPRCLWGNDLGYLVCKVHWQTLNQCTSRRRSVDLTYAGIETPVSYCVVAVQMKVKLQFSGRKICKQHQSSVHFGSSASLLYCVAHRAAGFYLLAHTYTHTYTYWEHYVKIFAYGWAYGEKSFWARVHHVTLLFRSKARELDSYYWMIFMLQGVLSYSLPLLELPADIQLLMK